MDACGVVHHVAVGIVASHLEGLPGGVAVLLAGGVEGGAFSDGYRAGSRLLSQPDHGAGHAGIGHPATVGVNVLHQIGLDDHHIAGVDHAFQPAGQLHGLTDHGFHLGIGGPGIAVHHAHLGRGLCGQWLSSDARLDGAHRKQSHQDADQED